MINDDILRGVYIPEKTIRIPLCGLVDVSGMLPVVKHLLFQNTLERMQLGFAYKVFPGARHTRFEHGLGTLNEVRNLIRHFRIANRQLVRALEMFALLHDIGHGPFSHEVEQVLSTDHDQVGLNRLEQMKKEISEYANYDLLVELFSGQHPLSALVHDKNFGADKLDYLQRDSHHSGYDIALNTDAIINYLQYQDGKIGIDEKSKEEIMAYQFSYLRMYSQVYFHKTVKTFTRMFTRALMDEFGQGRKIDSIVDDTDAEVLSKLLHHKLIQHIIRRIPFRTVAVFKIAGYEKEQRIREYDYPVYGVNEKIIRQWSKQISDPQFLTRLERSLENSLGLPDCQLLVVQSGFFKHLVMPDVLLYRKKRAIFESLNEQVPSHPQSLKEVADRSFYIRIAADQKAFPIKSFDLKQFFSDSIPLI